MHSNSYTLRYAILFTSLVAVILAVAASSLRPIQEQNIAQAKRAAILQSVMSVNPETLEADYNTFITEHVYSIDGSEKDGVSAFELDLRKELKVADAERNFPIYEFNKDGETRFIIPLQGQGLWGPISAFIAVSSDLDTISGVVFEHEKETPGLGAEINTDSFEGQYSGKELFGDSGDFLSVTALKGSGNNIDSVHEVDGLTGATMTLNGVNAMMNGELSKYEAILKSINS